MKISAHVLVKNEARFIWYSVMSVIDYVDKIIIWDTGSTDKTVEIIKELINSEQTQDKIEYLEKGPQDFAGLTRLREEMIKQTKSDWLLILDGDEIWSDEGINEIIKLTEHKNTDAIISPVKMLLGDIFHYQNESAGRYHIGPHVGHFNIRAIRNLPGLHLVGEYPNEAYVTKSGLKIQDLSIGKLLTAENCYLHASYLRKNNRRKYKYEIGISFPADYYYPEVLFRPHLKNIPSLWQKRSFYYEFTALWQTPLRKIKRMIIK